MSRNHTDGRARVVRRAILPAIVAMSLMAAIPMNAQAQRGGGSAEIEVDWHEDGMGFNVTSSKEISNVIVELCPPGLTHKHEAEFEEEDVKEWSHRELSDIVAIWVKSGNNHDPEGPQPPPPFNNPGAGEHFANPFADCEEPPVCVGPTGVTATAGPDHILVEWDPFGVPDEYNIYRGADGSELTMYDTVNGTTTEYNDTAVDPGVTYTYSVTAVLEGRESDMCARDSATVPEERCIGPTNIQATANPNETISLSWDGVNGEDGYNIYRQTGGGAFVFLAHVEAPTTEYLDDDVTVGVTYTYTVTATDGESESDRCDQASATAIPVFPSLIAASMAIFASLGAYGFIRRR